MPFKVTSTVTSPATVWLGARHTSAVAFTEIGGTDEAPNRQAKSVASKKNAPTTVTSVPPLFGPVVGETLEMVASR